MKKKAILPRLVMLAAILPMMVLGYHLMFFEHLPFIFSDPYEDLSYGWYVPLFTLYVLYRDRTKLVESLGEPSWLGAILTLPFLFIGYLGARGGQVRFEIVGFIGLLIALTWAFFGQKTMRTALFALLFLFFCLPLHTFLDVITIHLRLLSSSVAYGILKGLGVDLYCRGTMLISGSGDFAIDIAAPCSGLRSLFAMLALTVGYAYFSQPTWPRRVLLIALAIPIAVIGNIFRIFSIVAVAAGCSSDFATGFYHDYSGYVVFIAAIALMVATDRLITVTARRRKEAK